MLAFEERQWLNSYHAQVRSVLLPLLSDEAERAWLENATLPI
jgi:Xaa-Pro aminopeptidase